MEGLQEVGRNGLRQVRLQVQRTSPSNVSDRHCRRLDFPRNNQGWRDQLAPQLRWAALFSVVALAIDLAHYVYGTFNTNATLDRLRDEERDAVVKGNAWPHDPKGPPPDVTQGGVKAMFCLKTASTVVGAGLLLYYPAIESPASQRLEFIPSMRS